MRKEKKVIASVLLSASLLFGSCVIFNQDEIKADYYDDYEFTTTTTPAPVDTAYYDIWYEMLISVPTKKVYFIGEELNLDGLSVHHIWEYNGNPNPTSGNDITSSCDINSIMFDNTKHGIYNVIIENARSKNFEKLSFDLEVIEKGDIDKNSNISILDLVKMKKNLLGIENIENQNDICDLNRDGSLTSLDIVELINILLV
jgi:hypothetical protein